MVVKRVPSFPDLGGRRSRPCRTTYVKRHDLTMRMSMRCFTRLTNGFSINAENLQHALALNFMLYDFCR